MGDSQQELEEGARAAACVAADAAFSALDASGAPVIVASGDPLRVAFMNDPARVLFGEDAARMGDLLFRGDDPGSRRLVEVISALRESSALRLERLRVRFLGQAQIVTVLCRTLGEESGGYFLIAALGVRPDAPADDQRPTAAADAISEETAELRRRLAARHGARAPRFLWRTDAEGRFIDVSHALADVLGEAAADILGRSVKDASQAFALDPAFARAVASHRAWSGVEVEWPLEGGYVPTTLGALPLRNSAQGFFGYQGYGVLHLDRARVAAPVAAAGSQHENPPDLPADNVIMLRAPSSTRVASDAAEALSSSERLAFDEIARALKEGSSVLSQADAAGDADRQPATTFGSNRELIARGPEQSALALARALEEKLARAKSENALLSGAFDLSRAPLAIMAVDATIIRANAQFAACFGADVKTLVNRNLVSVLSPSDAQTLAQHLTAFRQDASARLPLIMSPRGGGFPLDLTLRQLPVEGKPTILVSVELREDASSDERAIEAARFAAESANAAKSDFLTRVSHEIRTPLNAIIGFAEVMMEERLGPLGSPRYKEYLKDMHASGAHVLSLVNDLLDLSKIEAGKMELSFARVDANAVIAECASIMQAQANQGRVVIRLALAPGLPSLCADARSLKQILLNLLSNAVKFNEPGGQVIISSALNDAGSVIIRVKDTGIGMSEEDVATALEPFRQVDASRGASGTGLGLPLTKALIEANHASFSIESRRNEGTLIEIAFPPPQVLAAE
ncbi:MAG: PAS domain-containing protein [Alphaproteobacteria bacterium]|nr:PAS domain-containing protein [Alphaproteobacteria bacterium]MBM3639927.1 PAS domain-containing protein [Alphaproteobacteria bacterium]